MFDVGIAHGERPRLFLDMISFVDLGHDRRTYRFFQDTRHGRVLIAESANLDRIVAATTNYIARRLVEREQALAADWRNRARAEIQLKTAAQGQATGRARPRAARDAEAAVAASAGPESGEPRADVFVELRQLLPDDAGLVHADRA